MLKLRTHSSILFFLIMTNLPKVAMAIEDTKARPAEWAAPVHKEHNLHRVTPQLYRSAQLAKGDVPLLQSLGIKTVVSLRAFHSDQELLRDTGVTLVRIKILTWKISDDQVVAALRAIKAAEKSGGVLLHCQHGADRTGLVSAMYRMLYQNWTREQALDELMHGDYGYHSLWKNIPEYLKKVGPETIRQRVDAA